MFVFALMSVYICACDFVCMYTYNLAIACFILHGDMNEHVIDLNVLEENHICWLMGSNNILPGRASTRNK